MSGDKTTKKKLPLVIFIIGLLALIGGLSFLIFRLVSGPAKADAEFLINAGEWKREGENSVVWNFTEAGKGKLTTDNHLTDYDFIWAIEDGRLKIETSWLYDLNDAFEYSLDQGNKTLTLKNGSEEVKFRAAE